MTPSNQDKTSSPIQAPEAPIDVGSVLKVLLSTRDRRSFRLVVQEGHLIELAEIPEPGDNRIGNRFASMQGGWISLRDAAKRLAHGYYWLSRGWRSMGLRPKKVGRVLFFREADIAALIERQKPLGRGPGRPRKTVGVL